MRIKKLIERFHLSKKFVAQSNGFNPPTFFNKINPKNSVSKLTDEEEDRVLEFLRKMGDDLSRKAEVLQKKKQQQELDAQKEK